MKTRRRIPLNPCDCCIYGHHRWLARRQRGGNIAFMMVDLAGWIEPAVVRQALAAVMAAHPITVGSLRTSPLRLRPYWQLPSSPSREADSAAERAHVYEDLRGAADAAARMDRLCAARYVPNWDLSNGPQVRLEQYALPDEQTRLCLRWPHYLMDAEGAQGFLAELERQRPGAVDSRKSQLPGDRPVNVLVGTTLLQRLPLMMRGLTGQPSLPRSAVRHVRATDSTRTESYRHLHRCWQGRDFERFRERARQTMPPGPALYGRYLAAVVIRALERIYREERLDTSAFAITFPMKVRSPQRPDSPIRQPLTGNYLVTPTLRINRDKVGDLVALAADIHEQVQAFLKREGDMAQWAMLQAVALIHAWFYPAIFRFPFVGGTYTSGFSYYGEIESPLRRFAGADVLNIWGGGPTTTPPGWNPVFSRYGDRLNLSLTWTPSAIPDAMAERYVAYIEELLFATT